LILVWVAAIAACMAAAAQYPVSAGIDDPPAERWSVNCIRVTLQDGSVQSPIGCGFGPSLNRVRRFITDDEICDSIYDGYPHRVAIRCWPRGHEPALSEREK
jgi:hypothetical protein